MSFEQIWIIPLCMTFFNVFAFLLSFIIAFSQDHISFWPYISDSGALPPESCIFGQLLNLSALFFAATVYLRHRQIVEFYWHRLKQIGRWRTISCILLWIGYASALGISIVANFQEHNVIYMHYTGALFAFGCGLVYAWAQTVFSYNMNPKLASPIVSHCRLALCVCSTIFFFLTVIFGPILGHQPPHAKNNSNKTYCKRLYKWSGNETNYFEHTVGTVSEWVMAVCFQLYIISFVIELRRASCHAPKLHLLTFYHSDSETSMAIQQATTDIQRKLSRKGISCIGIPGSVLIDKNNSNLLNGYSAVEAAALRALATSGMNIWIKKPASMSGHLRRFCSDAQLNSPSSQPMARRIIPKRQTIPRRAASKRLRDSGFLNLSAHSSANDLENLQPKFLISDGNKHNELNELSNSYYNDKSIENNNSDNNQIRSNMDFSASNRYIKCNDVSDRTIHDNDKRISSINNEIRVDTNFADDNNLNKEKLLKVRVTPQFADIRMQTKMLDNAEKMPNKVKFAEITLAGMDEIEHR